MVQCDQCDIWFHTACLSGQLEPAPACVVNVISDIAFRMLTFSANRGGVSMFYAIVNVGFRMFITIEMFDCFYMMMNLALSGPQR